MLESHPFEPWLPGNARLLMLGTFPPAEKRWCMPWYYPNFQNENSSLSCAFHMSSILSP